MPECAEETTTQHHLGVGHGFGPVENDEFVYFAVFTQTNCDGNLESADSFDNNQLKKAGLSVSRASYITLAVFNNEVVKSGSNPKGALVGISRALTGAIRALISQIQLNSSQASVRAFCVLDSVLPGDYDAHATLNYGEFPQGVSASKIGAIRSRARLDLADVFSPIESQENFSFKT
jgi:hypothetical protein